MVLRNAIPAILTLVCLLLGITAGAQPGRIVVSIDEYRIDQLTGASRHEILPVAVFDGSAFFPAWEYDRALGVSSRRLFLLSNYRDVQVLYRGRSIGAIRVTDIYVQNYHCSEVIVGSGNYQTYAPLPPSEVTGASRGSNNGADFNYETAAYLALSGAVEPLSSDGPSSTNVVTDPDELARYASDIATLAPRMDLLPLGFDETDAYRFDAQDAVLVVRKRRSAGKIQGPAGIALDGPLFTDIAVVQTMAGQRRVLPLPGSGTSQDAFGKGPDDRLIDAFEVGDGKVYLLFERQNYEVWQARLYELAPDAPPAFLLEVELFGC